MTEKEEPTFYTLYLDSSGEPGWCPPYGKSKNKYYVNAGIAIKPSTDLKIQTELKNILIKYFGETARDNPHIELVYQNLITGTRAFEKIDTETRRLMADDVFNLIRDINPIIFATVVDKNLLKEAMGGGTPSKEFSIRLTMARFSLFLRDTNSIGTVVMDAEGKSDIVTQELILKCKMRGSTLINFNPRVVDKFDRILNSISFSESSITPGIQLADTCCRTVWQQFEYTEKNSRYSQIKPYFYEREPHIFR